MILGDINTIPAAVDCMGITTLWQHLAVSWILSSERLTTSKQVVRLQKVLHNLPTHPFLNSECLQCLELPVTVLSRTFKHKWKIKSEEL